MLFILSAVILPLISIHVHCTYISMSASSELLQHDSAILFWCTHIVLIPFYSSCIRTQTGIVYAMALSSIRIVLCLSCRHLNWASFFFGNAPKIRRLTAYLDRHFGLELKCIWITVTLSLYTYSSDIDFFFWRKKESRVRSCNGLEAAYFICFGLSCVIILSELLKCQISITQLPVYQLP